MKKLKIAVMGCANIARRTVIPTIKSLDQFELLAVGSRSKEKAEIFANQFNCTPIKGYDQLLEMNDLDAIYMPLPTGLHEEWVIRALDKGLHIMIEKSLAMNFESAQKMVSLAKEKDLLIMENFMFLYHCQHQKVKELLENGEIGKIRCFRSSFGFPPLAEDNFRYNREAGGGSLLDAAAYTIRASQLVLGNKINVCASSLNYEDKEVDIYGGAFLKGSNGTFSEVAFGFDNYYQCNYEIWGSKGKLTLHKAFTPRPTEKPKLTIEKQDKIEEVLLPADDHFKNIFTEFYNCIQSKQFANKYDEILNQSRLLTELMQKSESNE